MQTFDKVSTGVGISTVGVIIIIIIIFYSFKWFGINSFYKQNTFNKLLKLIKVNLKLLLILSGVGFALYTYGAEANKNVAKKTGYSIGSVVIGLLFIWSVLFFIKRSKNKFI